MATALSGRPCVVCRREEGLTHTTAGWLILAGKTARGVNLQLHLITYSHTSYLFT